MNGLLRIAVELFLLVIMKGLNLEVCLQLLSELCFCLLLLLIALQELVSLKLALPLSVFLLLLNSSCLLFLRDLDHMLSHELLLSLLKLPFILFEFQELLS